MTTTELPVYKPKDFASDQDVRWCPGCGDYAILKAVQKTLPSLPFRKEDYVFVSGIGCAARFPYYMSTYGLHSIHGRAPAFATGIKLANPDLQVWVVSGDGDLLSIGGNHTMHVIRRNVNINIMLLNNRIYGLTKGQYSPTSEFGKRTKSTPAGSIDYPVNPLSIAIGAGCTFVARCIDVDVKMLEHIMLRAAQHRGTSFVEVYQDCNIYNHKAWFYASQKDSRPAHTADLEHGKPIIFGENRDRGLVMPGSSIEAVNVADVGEDDLLVHDEHNRGLAFLLANLRHPEFPEPLGVLYADDTKETYERLAHDQLARSVADHGGKGDLEALINEGEIWTVDDDEE